jgi:hypothetical protein
MMAKSATLARSAALRIDRILFGRRRRLLRSTRHDAAHGYDRDQSDGNQPQYDIYQHATPRSWSGSAQPRAPLFARPSP